MKTSGSKASSLSVVPLFAFSSALIIYSLPVASFARSNAVLPLTS
jgi:hypothetical protein